MFQMMSVIMSNHVAAVRLARYIQPSAEYPWFARIRAWQELLGRRLLQLTNFARFAKLDVECNWQQKTYRSDFKRHDCTKWLYKPFVNCWKRGEPLVPIKLESSEFLGKTKFPRDPLSQKLTRQPAVHVDISADLLHGHHDLTASYLMMWVELTDVILLH